MIKLACSLENLFIIILPKLQTIILCNYRDSLKISISVSINSNNINSNFPVSSNIHSLMIISIFIFSNLISLQLATTTIQQILTVFSSSSNNSNYSNSSRWDQREVLAKAIPRSWRNFRIIFCQRTAMIVV